MKALALAVLSWAAMLGAISADPGAFKRALQDSAPGVVQIVVHSGGAQQALGTGFFVGTDGTLVTNAHVIDGARVVYAKFRDGRAVPCRLVQKDLAHDLAVLRLTEPPQGGVRALRIAPATTRPEQLDELLLISDPKGFEGTPVIGTFSRDANSREVKTSSGARTFPEDFPMYQLSIPATHGSSGGPVLDRTGQVLAVVQGGPDDGRLSILFCIPHVELLNLGFTGQARPFSGEREGLQLDTNFSHTRLDYVPDPSLPPDVRLQDDSVVALRSDNWGYIDANTVGTVMDDWFKAGQLVAPNQFAELARRNRLVHVVNTAFRFSVVIPEKYRLSERYDPTTRIFTSIITDPQTNAPLRITARRIQPVPPDQLGGMFYRLGTDFVKFELGLDIMPVVNAPGQAYVGPLSDPEPRWSAVPGRVKLWSQYLCHPAYDTGYVVLIGLNRDIFITVDVPYRPSQSGFWPADLVERMFTASTVSFID